ncbi:MAG: host specificity protein [Rickettsia endosymbiont of Gnoriste bilineata]|nr:host specificity protein [Rickettsia endosymbiont of Gnoriste bilineata]
MFGQILGNIGSSIGGVFGGWILSTIGRFAGKALGDYLEYLNHEPEEYYHFKNIRFC